MSQPEIPPPPRPHWTTISVVLFILGLMILIPTGLCTAVFGVAALGGGGGAEFLGMALMVALPFAAVGFALVFAGLGTRRRD